MQSEIKHFHFSNTSEPIHRSDLTDKEKAEVFKSHIFIKQKRDGNIKGRTVAGGNKQRAFISK